MTDRNKAIDTNLEKLILSTKMCCRLQKRNFEAACGLVYLMLIHMQKIFLSCLLRVFHIVVKPHPDHVQWNHHLNGYGPFQTAQAMIDVLIFLQKQNI